MKDRKTCNSHKQAKQPEQKSLRNKVGRFFFARKWRHATGTRAKLEETADGKYLVFPNIKECTDARKRLKNAKFLDGYVRLEPMQHEYDVYTLSYIADEGPD